MNAADTREATRLALEYHNGLVDSFVRERMASVDRRRGSLWLPPPDEELYEAWLLYGECGSYEMWLRYGEPPEAAREMERITVHLPNGSTFEFDGYVNILTPGEGQEGEGQEAEIVTESTSFRFTMDPDSARHHASDYGAGRWELTLQGDDP